MHIGCAVVSVPPKWETSTLLDVPPVDGQPDPEVHYSFQRYQMLWPKPTVPRNSELVLEEQETGTRALLYLHGYNTSFREALLRAAQLAAGLDEGTRVYMFSWPSQRKVLAYAQDMDNAERAEASLQKFIQLLMRDTTIRNLDIIAHSMGSQGLLRSITALRPVFDHRFNEQIGETRQGDNAQPAERKDRVRLGQVIFAAPDVSSLVFRERLSQLAPFANRVTVYTSAADKALKWSEFVRGKNPRAGTIDTTGQPIQLHGSRVHVIDATADLPPRLSLDRYVQLNHNYFADDPSVFADILSLLRDNTRRKPPDRLAKNPSKVPYTFLEMPYAENSAVKYWKIKRLPGSSSFERQRSAAGSAAR
jgi:esterase/lipase superfamily enzyme